MQNPYGKHIPDFYFVLNCGSGNNFSHQDCQRGELGVDEGRNFEESGENLEIFIPFVLISEAFFFPGSCRKTLSLRAPHQGCPLVFCDPQPRWGHSSFLGAPRAGGEAVGA